MIVVDSILERLDAAAEARLRHDDIPGMGLALLNREGVLAVRAYGQADRISGEPLRTDHHFEFGSIGKSFTCILLLQLAEEGVLDLHAPVTAYLPWLEIPSEHGPITLHHLMTHTAGIVNGSDFPADPRYEVWALRDTRATTAPGERFHYSNVGYKALGLVLQRVTGKSYAQLVRERILTLLGSPDIEPAITHDVRPKLATGHALLYDDRPWHPRHAAVPATWLETDTADGCMTATPHALGEYLRMVLNGGVADGGRILSESAFEKMTTPYIDRAEDVGYGYGLMIDVRDGRHWIGHTGGMVGYYALMLGDMETGNGVVTMINVIGSQRPVAEYALQLLNAVSQDTAFPEPPEITPREVVKNAHELAGNYGAVALVADGERLVMRTDARQVRLLTGDDDDAFIVDDPEWDRFPLRVERNESGAPVGLTHGGRWFPRDGVDMPPAEDHPEEWHAFVGHYRSHNPWLSNFRVVLRLGELYWIEPSGDEEPMSLLGDGCFRVGEEGSPEFIRFDTIVDGEAWRANFSGADYYRFFTP